MSNRKNSVFPYERGHEEALVIAHHEAGHAVVAVALGLKINFAEMRERETPLGMVVAEVNVADYWNSKVFGQRERFEFAKRGITMLFAGAEAQRLMDDYLFVTLNAINDLLVAGDLIPTAKIFPDGRPKYIRGCNYFGDIAYWSWLNNRQKDARRIVRREKAAIEAVAHKFMQAKGRVFTHEEIEEIVNPLLTRISLDCRDKFYSNPNLAKFAHYDSSA